MYLRFLFIALFLPALLAADWTRFRGPNGTGHAADKDVPVKWTDDNVLWKTELTGTGHSSPIVVKGKVFLLSATKTERMITCIDADKGKPLWTKKVAGAVARKPPKSSFASATLQRRRARLLRLLGRRGRRPVCLRLRWQTRLGAKAGQVHQPARPRL